jgi:DNA-binding transcriptional LysR family regulator
MSWVLPQREALMRERPWLKLHLYFSAAPNLLELVKAMQIDCAITSLAPADAQLGSINLHREEYLLVAAPQLLAARPLRSAEDALHHTLIDLTAALPLFRYFRDGPKGSPLLRFANEYWGGSIAAVRHEVLRGAGVAVLPAYFVRGDIGARKLARVFPHVPLQHDYLRLVFRASDPRRPLLDSLAEGLMRVPLR